MKDCKKRESLNEGISTMMHIDEIRKDFRDSTTGKIHMIAQSILQCFRNGESVIYLDTKGYSDNVKLMDIAENLGYHVWNCDESKEIKPDFGQFALDSKEFRKPSHKKEFQHLTFNFNPHWEKPDIWFKTYLKHSITELSLEADARMNGLEIPVNVVIDNLAILRWAFDDFDAFIAATQRRSEWNLHIITQIL